MPKFRGLPRGKRPDYFGPKQHRYNTPRAIGDWETRPSRGNRRWSFFLRGKSERGLRFQIDDPIAARKYRSFRRLWCRSLKIDPIPFTPISDNGQARGWRFLSPGSDTGYWEVIAYPGDNSRAEWCENISGQPRQNFITYIDDAGVEKKIRVDGPIRYEYENDPSDIPDNQCEYGVQCRTIGRVTYVGYYESGAVVNNILDFDLGPCEGPSSTLAVKREQQGGLDTCEWGNGESYTGPDLTVNVTPNTIPTYFNVYINGKYKTRLYGSSISEEVTSTTIEIGIEGRGKCSSVSGWHTFVEAQGISMSLGPSYTCSDGRVGFEGGTITRFDGSSYESPWNYIWPGWRPNRTTKTISTDLEGQSYSYTSTYYWYPTVFSLSPSRVEEHFSSWEGNGDYNFKLYSEGALVIDKNYTYDPSPVLTSDGGSGDWMFYVEKDGVEVYSDGPFSRNPGGSWFPIQKKVPYYDCKTK